MIRTQVYLPKNLYQNIQLVAEKEQKPAAEIIRELLHEGVARKYRNAGKTLLLIAKKAVKGADPKLSHKVDKYLYEDV